MEVEVDRCFGFDVYGPILVMYQCGNSLVLESGIQPLVWYVMGYILGILLFQSKQSTYDVFCHFPQWSCGN